MKLDILTPEKSTSIDPVESVTLPGTMGLFTVLPGHAPMISSLRPDGVLSYVQEGHKTSFRITGGFVDVLQDTVAVCTEGLADPVSEPVEIPNCD